MEVAGELRLFRDGDWQAYVGIRRFWAVWAMVWWMAGTGSVVGGIAAGQVRALVW